MEFKIQVNTVELRLSHYLERTSLFSDLTQLLSIKPHLFLTCKASCIALDQIV
ncbi:hypothetical protein HanRHA438_Chr09g0425561 [Helianthus annuus]|nr:hypothetical protein HanRHA438_Chr09g0425561 [Helianthus annuus]